MIFIVVVLVGGVWSTDPSEIMTQAQYDKLSSEWQKEPGNGIENENIPSKTIADVSDEDRKKIEKTLSAEKTQEVAQEMLKNKGHGHIKQINGAKPGGLDGNTVELKNGAKVDLNHNYRNTVESIGPGDSSNPIKYTDAQGKSILVNEAFIFPEAGQVPQQPQPRPTGPGAPGNPGGAGGSGGGGDGQKLTGAMDALGKVTPLLGAIPKPTPSQDNAPPAPGAVTPSVATDLYGREEGEEEGEGGPEVRVTASSEGTSFRFVENKLDLIKDGGIMQVSSIPNIDGTYAEVNAINGDVNEIELTNTITRVSTSGEVVADLYTPSETTPLSLSPASGEPQIAMSSTSPITAAAISDINSNQFIKLINYDLAFGGERILVDVFKSFEKVSGDGNKLYVKNGGMYLKFNGKKIFYSRRIKGSPHSLGEISNVKDRANKFSLIEYAENRGRLKDMRGRVSVGDKKVVHPRDGRLKVAGFREGMWVKR